jgi:hypothetical protein
MKKLIFICLILLGISTANAQSIWRYKLDVDKVSGETTEHVVGTSTNSITGVSDNSSKVQLFVTCKKHDIKLQTMGVGFHVDNVDCNSVTNVCENIQYSRVKFDNSQPQLVIFDVDGNNKDIMRLTKRGTYLRDDMVTAMKAGNRMYLEITPLNTKKQKQIVELSLIGFTAAINQCKEM